MSGEIRKIRISVIKRSINQDLIDEYIDDEYKDMGLCNMFKDKQEFIIDPYEFPKEFCDCCAHAWADIRGDIMLLAAGGSMPGINKPGVVISGCTDWFRPVYFKLERIE